MKNIQQVASEILQNHPDKFYIFGGEEFGLKSKYLDSLRQYYDNNCEEYETVSYVIDMMNTMNLFSSLKGLYIVRYDKSFLSGLNNDKAESILNCSIRGTLVLIYENDDDVSKCDKYFPNNTVIINKVSDNLVTKYLMSDIPGMPDRCYQLAAKLGKNYGHSRNILESMNKVSNLSIWNRIEDRDAEIIFAKDSISSNEDFRIGTASKNCNYLCSKLEDYVGEYDRILYCILQTLLEIDKIKSSKYSDSNISKYAARWSVYDIYNMFNQVCHELEMWRSYSLNFKDRLIYIFSLMRFSSVPDLEVLS